MVNWEANNVNSFLYFAYGENIFTYRLHMQCPNAEFFSIARVDNYRLDFIGYSKFWGGPSTTLVPTANAHAWGVIWRLRDEDRVTLDHMKGVEVKKYYIKYVDVLTPYKGQFRCRAYMQKVIPLPRGDNDEIPVERWPSYTTKQVLIEGALEHGLPEYYIKGLKKLNDNGEEGCLRMFYLLNRYATQPSCECRVPGRIPRIPLKLNKEQAGTRKRKKVE